jgi:molybdate/tungstate transport system substrate-binding protein
MEAGETTRRREHLVRLTRHASVAVIGLMLAASGATAGLAAASERPAAPQLSGTANVAFAGSLQLLNEKVIGPAFTKATGYRYQGRGGGSFGLAREIASSEISPNVFESVGAGPLDVLEPKFTSWYLEVAASPIVVAYNPHSRFGPELTAIAKGKKPLSELFSLMARPGFYLGRTNPDTDPQGQAFYEMVKLAQSHYHLPAGTARKILGPVDNSPEVFAETALDARLQAGQLDAASAFLSQAVQLHLPYIALPSAIDFGSPSLASAYAKATLTIAGGKTVHGVPLVVDATVLGHHDRSAAASYIAYLLSPAARKQFRHAGYRLLAPKLIGNMSAIPEVIRHAVAHP